MYSPYPSEAANTIYNLLFCDDASAFLARSGEEPAPWQAELAQDPPDLRALRILAAQDGLAGFVLCGVPRLDRGEAEAHLRHVVALECGRTG